MGMQTALLAALALVHVGGLVTPSEGLLADEQQLWGRAPDLLIAAGKKKKKPASGGQGGGKGFGETNQKTTTTRPDESAPQEDWASPGQRTQRQESRQRKKVTVEELCATFQTRLPQDSTTVVCPCGGEGIGEGNAYASCCEPYHRGVKVPESPLRVLQTRYTAHAVRLPLYLIQTTADENPDWQADPIAWAAQLDDEGLFDDFQLLQLTTGPTEYSASGDEAYIDLKVNVARLVDGAEGVFWERNKFVKNKNGDGWLYANGELEVSSYMRDPSEEEIIDVIATELDVQCEAAEEEKLECETFWEGELHRPEQRRRGEALSATAQWQEEWQHSFGCWWLSLAAPTRTALGSCMGALALHVGSRLDASWRAAQALLGRRVDGSAGASADAFATEQGCEWISEGAQRLELPDAPSFPNDLNFRLPPIPQLLPAWQQLQSLRQVVRQTPQLQPSQQPSQHAEQPHSQWVGLFLGGAGIGVGAGVLLFLATIGSRRCIY